MIETKYLPVEIIAKGEQFARSAHWFYFRILDLAFILICILGPWWTPFIAIALALLVLYVREDSQIMWKHQKGFWFLFAISFVLSGAIFAALIRYGVEPPWVFIPFLAEIAVIKPLERKAELAYYNSQGYDYRGHLGQEL